MATERPSKSAQKRAAQAIRALADELVSLKPALVGKVVADEDVASAVREAQAINSHGALRRQKQYIALRLRDVDVDAIRDALNALQADDKQDKRLFRAAEQLRDALLSEPAQTQSLLDAAGVSTSEELHDTLRRYASASDTRTRKQAARSVFRQLYAAMSATPPLDLKTNQD